MANAENARFLLKEETHRIIGCAFEVLNELGHGLYEKIYENKNHLIGEYPGANGIKTGWTTMAKHCLVASAKRDGVSLIAVILGADDMYADVKKLFAYGFSTRG